MEEMRRLSWWKRYKGRRAIKRLKMSFLKSAQQRARLEKERERRAKACVDGGSKSLLARLFGRL